MSAKIAIVFGAGAFGTSIANVLAENFDQVFVKVRSLDVYESIKLGENSVYLPGQQLSAKIIPALSFEELNQHIGANRVKLIVNGLPTSAIKKFYGENQKLIQSYFDNGARLVSLSKGIDAETLEMSDDFFMDCFSEYQEKITYLSGPSFAKEIIDKQVTVVNIAGQSSKVLLDVCNMLKTDYFKAFPTYDIKGVLLGGALKNILAIAGGIIEGLGYNHNTRAAMITRGITEMLRFGHVFDAKPETFYSFAGMGDLILTTTSSLSRNKSFGLEIAKGRTPKEIIDSSRSVVEGYKTTEAAFKLAQKHNIKANLFSGIYDILYKGDEPQRVIKRLMRLPINQVE